jgi:hypothetical protein
MRWVHWRLSGPQSRYGRDVEGKNSGSPPEIYESNLYKCHRIYNFATLIFQTA